MFVSQRMTHNPITIRPETPVTEAHTLMRKHKVHRFPVVDAHQKLLGIVTEKDLLYAMPSPATTLTIHEMNSLTERLNVTEVMTKSVITVQDTTLIEEAASLMADHDVGGLPVLRDGSLVGIITESDLFKTFIELFGFREKGVRVTAIVPEVRGELSRITTAISQQGGNIVSLGTFLGDTMSEGILTLKIQDMTLEAIRDAIQPFVKEITDIRQL